MDRAGLELASRGSPVGEVLKILSVGHRLKLISRIQEKTVAREVLQGLLRGSTIAIISPCARPAHVAESWPRAGLQVLQNSGSQMFMLRVKTLSVRDRH